MEDSIFKPMLAYDSKFGTKFIDPKKMYMIEPKLDGVRALIKINLSDLTFEIYSRTLKRYKTFETLLQGRLMQLAQQARDIYEYNKLTTCVFDSEITGNSFKEVSALGHMKEVPKDFDGSSLTINIFDCITPDNADVPLFVRKSIFFNFSSIPQINFIKDVVFSGEELLDLNKVQSICKSYVEDKGYEGIMLKDLQGKYIKGKKSKSWLKVKPVKTIDLEIVDYLEGEGKYYKSLGSLLCKSADGYHVSVGSGLTDSQRKELYNNFEDYRHSIVEVQYQEKTQDKQGRWSLRFPVFKTIRNDKDAPDYLREDD